MQIKITYESNVNSSSHEDTTYIIQMVVPEPYQCKHMDCTRGKYGIINLLFQY